MPGFDIYKVPKKKTHQLHGNHGDSRAFDIAPTPVPDASVGSFVQEEKYTPHIDEQVQLAAERLKKQYDHYEATPAVTLKKASQKMVFRKAYVMFAFTFFVLGFGIFLGARFVSFANSISTTKSSFYKTITNNIGAVLGPVIPALQGLDDTKIGNAIREKGDVDILLLGYGGAGHSGSYLTDTLMLLNVNFENDKVTFIPIPRDLWVKVPTRGYDGGNSKINSAYSVGLDEKRYPNKLPQFTGLNGGGELAMYAVKEVTGIEPDYYAAVDFQGFKEIVDALGGVNVDVENAFTDYSYPTGSANVNAPACRAEDIPDALITDCRYKKLHFEKGEQVMDGSRALEYVRSRHAAGVEGSDYARSRRQQKLIAAIEEKAISFGALPKIFEIMESIQGHFRTDLSFAEIKDLSKYIGEANEHNMQNIVMSSSGLLVSGTSEDGQWILMPRKGNNDFSEIQKYIQNALANYAKAEDNTNTAIQ